MADWMSANRKVLSKKYKLAARRVTDVERRLEAVSKHRLTELLKLSKMQRLNAIDDADLLPNERNELRKSLLIDDAPPNWHAVAWRTKALLRRHRVLSFSSLLRACCVAALILPVGYYLYVAWRNTGELIVASSPVTVDWQMPSGKVLRRTVPAGESLVLLKRSDGSYVLRKWYAREGYAIAKINVADHL
ncbi:hypothetical protein [Bradyrhizobium sp. CB2312]|uniref:hypothetical protein n=1 Tax=Bradyrhizobium sp. CB2312 TaxID=3039155 RepID=UPI0024B1FCD6|nr:hypothetical protein [Bradyrhizobium sp. CB2312]WFU72907.1 hypothetical protein QA642_02150 [Bradyrhizobium sp. CB2312]